MSTAPPRRRSVLAFPAHPDDKSLGPAAITTDLLIAAARRSTMDEPAGHALHADTVPVACAAPREGLAMTRPSGHPALRGRPIYLDYNATTPVDPAVVEAMIPYLTREFGNPSSSHIYGVAANAGLDLARHQLAQLLGAPAETMVFTGSGSEADALAIRGTVLAVDRTDRRHVITQVTEHPAVLAACRELEQFHGVAVTYLGVDRHGRVDPAEVAAAITSDTVLVSVMHANNETGTIQPIAAIAEETRARGVLLHVDAAQSLGKIDVNVDALAVDLLTVVGHKVYAPKGIGALYIRPGDAGPPAHRRRRPGAGPTLRHRKRRPRRRIRRSRNTCRQLAGSR